MKPKGIETSGALADNSTKLCTDRPTAVEEVTSLVNMTSWRSSLRWEESYKPSPIWRSQKIHSKTRTELLFLGTEKSKQRYQKKSCINPEHQPQKAPRPQGLHWDSLSLLLPGVCSLALLQVGPEKSLLPSQDLVRQTFPEFLKKGSPFPGQANRDEQFSHFSALAIPRKHSIWWASKNPSRTQRLFLQS